MRKYYRLRFVGLQCFLVKSEAFYIEDKSVGGGKLFCYIVCLTGFKEKQMRSKKGLTLIELLIVVIILGALAAIAIPRVTVSATTAKINACNANVDSLNKAMEMYKVDNSLTSYPTLATVTADINYFPDGAPVCPFGTAYALKGDGTNRVQPHSH